MLKRYFWGQGRSPDMAVLNFQTSWLEDGKNEDIGRLALAFTTRADWPEILSRDIRGTGDRVDFLVSTQWVTYGIRDRLRERILTLVVPDYRRYVSRVHQLNRSKADGTVRTTATYHSLQRLLERARQFGTRICLVAGPSAQPYEIDPAVKDLVEREGSLLLDMRGIPEIDAKSFRDGIHLNSAARTRYSRRLGRELGGLLIAPRRAAHAQSYRFLAEKHVGTGPPK
jgi:hypothetical protein